MKLIKVFIQVSFFSFLSVLTPQNCHADSVSSQPHIFGDMNRISVDATKFDTYGLGLYNYSISNISGPDNTLEFNINPSDFKIISKVFLYTTGKLVNDNNLPVNISVNNNYLTGVPLYQIDTAGHDLAGERNLRFTVKYDITNEGMINSGNNSFTFTNVYKNTYSAYLVIFYNDPDDTESQVFASEGYDFCWNAYCKNETINIPTSSSDRVAQISLLLSEVQNLGTVGAANKYSSPRTNFIYLTTGPSTSSLIKDSFTNAEGDSADVLDWRQNKPGEPVITPMTVPANSDSIKIQPISVCIPNGGYCQFIASMVSIFYGVRVTTPNRVNEPTGRDRAVILSE